MSGPVGRYAPTPSGTLHLGNLRTALAAWLSIRARGGTFLLRIEDIDRARCRPEWELRQLADLRALGLDWDSEPVRQSERKHHYAEALQALQRGGHCYPCFCSRKDLRDVLSAPHDEGEAPYPRRCASLSQEEQDARIAAGRQHALRFRVEDGARVFLDVFLGEREVDLGTDGGDFIIRRADGEDAYQLACAVDDGLQGVTEVVRGEDLLGSGARQAALLHSLGHIPPQYAHVPLMQGEDGKRLSKREGADDLGAFLGAGFSVEGIRGYLAYTLGQCGVGERPALEDLVRHWRWDLVPRIPWNVRREELGRFR